MNRVLQSVCTLGAALLLLAGAARAEAANGEDMHGLNGDALTRRYVANGLIMRMLAIEWASRVMLVKHCTADDRKEPMSPRMMVTVDAVQKWMIDGPPTNKMKAASFQGMRLLQEAAFTSGELAEWDRFRKSSQVQRALNIIALLQAVEVTGESLTDNRNGRDWDWPLANLREMADTAQLRPYLDKALDKVSPGSAATLAKVSAVPSEIRDDAAGRELHKTFEKDSENLQKAMMAQLSQADKQAVDALVQQPVYLRLQEIAVAWREFHIPESKPDYKITVPPPELETVASLCDKLKLPACKPDSPLAQGLEKARRDYRSVQDSDPLYPFPQIYEVVKSVPEAGCPQTKP